MNVLDSIPFDIFQTIVEELSLSALVSFASTRKSHASVPIEAIYERIAQLKEAHLAKEAEEYAEEEAKWFPNGEGNIEDGEQGSDWSEDEF